MINFGSWITVGTITGAALATADRLLVGVLISTAAIVYYATPHLMITKLLIVPSALVEVLFSAFSASFLQDSGRTAVLFSRGIKFVFIALFPIALIIVTFASEGLSLWLGTEFAERSTRPLQLLTIGVFVNGVALIPWTLLQGGGRPDLAAKLNLIELPLYALLLWWLIGSYGIEGAGVAWATRAVVDALILFIMIRQFLPISTPFVNGLVMFAPVTLLIMALAMMLTTIAVKGIFLFLIMNSFALVSWFFVLTPEERAQAEKMARRVRQSMRSEKEK